MSQLARNIIIVLLVLLAFGCFGGSYHYNFGYVGYGGGGFLLLVVLLILIL